MFQQSGTSPSQETEEVSNIL